MTFKTQSIKSRINIIPITGTPIGFTILVCLLFLFSCENKNSTDLNSGSSYFDIKSYLKAQTDSLQRDESIWLKTVKSGEKSEEKNYVANSLQWETELAMFLDADLNKKSYAGKFSIDSSINQSSRTIRYTSEKTKIKEFTVVYTDSETWPEITCRMQNKNVFYQSEYQIKAKPFAYYNCSGNQEISGWGESKKFDITWQNTRVK